MAVYPGANYRPIAPGSNDPPIVVIGAILHVDAGNSKSLYGYFKDKSGGIESHFHVPKEGKPEQYRDTGREADANYKANSFLKDGKRYGYVSIESQGLERGEWNAHQLDELKKLLAWLSKTHKFPLQRCPAHTQPGVGYHVMFGAPGPWTPVSKSCPGPDRVKQFNNILVPWFKTAGNPTTTSPTLPEEDMPLTDADVQKILNTMVGESTVKDCLVKARWLAQEFGATGSRGLQLDRIEADTDPGGV